MYSLGIVSDEIDRDARRAIEIGSRLSITCYELRFLQSGRVPDVDERELCATLECARRRGATITAISPGIYKYARSLAQARAELDERFARAAALAHRLSLPYVICFGPAKPMAGDLDGPSHSSANPPQWVTQALYDLADAARACDVRVAIEPEPLSYTDTAAATAALLRSIDRCELRVNYDPGNLAWAQGEDPRDGVEVLGSYIANVHVKNLLDTPRQRAPQWSPADLGVIDYAHQFAELRRIGYTGPVSLEPHIDGRPITIVACRIGALSAMEEMLFIDGRQTLHLE